MLMEMWREIWLGLFVDDELDAHGTRTTTSEQREVRLRVGCAKEGDATKGACLLGNPSASRSKLFLGAMNAVQPLVKNDPSIQKFLRTATAEEKSVYAQVKGSGSSARKREFRDMVNAQKLKNLIAAQTNVASSTEQQSVVGTYHNFWVIAEKEGGLNGQGFWH